jgi:uncharacterized protein
MNILISGSSGLVGSALSTALQSQGHTLARLVRRSADHTRREVYWDPEQGSIDKTPLVDIAPEVVINLAGENIAGGRWNARRKAAIRNSRVNGTHILSQALASLDPKPKVLLCASAVGYYGDRGEEVLLENSGPGNNFLAKVCQDWELATEPARQAGIRVVNIRIGVVLSKKGGALKKMLLPFRLGMGGVMGNGRQYFSWITLEDLVRVFLFAMTHPEISGPVNAVAPHPVTNRQFTKALGKALFRPTLIPMPASTARLVLGEMADELLLASARVQPGVLDGAGFQFNHTQILPALRAVLK